MKKIILCTIGMMMILTDATSYAGTCQQDAYATMRRAQASRKANNAEMSTEERNQKLAALLRACSRLKSTKQVVKKPKKKEKAVSGQLSLW